MSKGWIVKVGLILSFIVLAACTSKIDQVNTSKQAEPLEGKILMWVEMPFTLTETQNVRNKEVLEDILEEFHNLYPQVQVLVKFFPSRQILQPFKLQVERGAGPDLLLVYSSPKILPLIERGALKSLDESQVDKSQFRPKALKSVYYRGQLYGLPMYLSTQVLCYNQEKIDQVPTNLTELIGQTRQGYGVGIPSGFAETFWGTGGFGGKLFDDQGQVILSQGGGWAKWMEWLKNARNEPNFILSKNAKELQKAFVQGKLAYVICSSGSIPYLSGALGKNKLGVALLPGHQNQPATPELLVGLLLFNQASSSNQNQIALKLAQFLTNVEQQNEIKTAIPFIPTNNKVTFNRYLFPIGSTLLDQSKTAVAVALDDTKKVTILAEYGEIFYQQVLAGAISPDEAAIELTQIANRQFGSEEQKE